ncbi:aminoglycoside phosphotransferase family protein [Novosphingobium sp. P6W]|nr:aminoglycoside phosphotransferase family protein [Novosphingobium sp. P6W]
MLGNMERSVERDLAVPVTLAEALDPSWLQAALAPISGNAPVIWVGDIDNFETVAAKVRFGVRFANDPGTVHRFCLKAMLGSDNAQMGGATAVREAEFYARIAPQVSLRVPRTLAVINREGSSALLIMEDLIDAGARFCSALDPFTPALTEQSLDQIARLHAGSALLAGNDWIPLRLAYLATSPHFAAPELQALMDGPRCARLNDRTSNAALLLDGMKQLERRFAGSPMTILHGDCHAGNFYLTDEGPGLTDWQLIQRGNWAQDVAYHIAAVLPEEIAAREERGLLSHYLDCVRAHGGTVPDATQAWDDYRAAQIYGYYHWAITRWVDPQIVDIFVQRLGAGIERHDTYALLGL